MLSINVVLRLAQGPKPQTIKQDLLGMLQGEDVSRAESGGVSGGEGLLDEGGVGIILAVCGSMDGWIGRWMDG